MDPEDGLLYRILDAARNVHLSLGPGFVEGIYGRALTIELRNSGFRVDREKAIKVWYGASLVGKHRLDLVVDQSVIIELKASRTIIPVHIAQMNSYLYASDYPWGLLLNFGTTELQWEIVRPGCGVRGNSGAIYAIKTKTRRALRLLGVLLIPATT